MSTWLDALLEAGEARRVLVSVAQTRGSAPREPGARMLVWDDGIAGTIGGGNLEYQAIEAARGALLDAAPAAVRLQRFALGPGLGQCCGGVVRLLFEIVRGDEACFTRLHALREAHQAAALLSVVDGDAAGARLLVTGDECHGELTDAPLRTALTAAAREALAAHQTSRLLTLTDHADRPVQVLVQTFRPSDFNVLVFGAGHVGSALVPLLGQLPCDVTWIDQRPNAFPDTVAGRVATLHSATPEYCVDEAPPGSYYLVMTHDHALDQAICERILRRGDAAYCGLIGSRAKRLKFEKRLRVRGIPAPALQELVCPIGVPGIDGKRPAEIAVAVAAQLLIEYGQRNVNETRPPGPAAARGE